MIPTPANWPSPTTAAEAAGRLLTVGFDGTGYERRFERLFRDVAPAGVILFSRNIKSVRQTRRLIADLKKLSEDLFEGRPLFVAVDQEGGRVARLSADLPTWPAAKILGDDGSAEQVETIHADIGRVLRNLGFTVDFAPVLDLGTNLDSPVIGDRAFSADPEKTALLGRAAIRGLRREGLLACGKHFPGHGDTTLDSHYALPEDPRPAARFDEAELVPFRSAVEEGVDMIMTAHVVYPAFDKILPATLSPTVVTGLLREKLGFGGIVVGDDLDMKAIAGRWSDGEAAIMAIDAGCDHLLVCHETPRRREVHRALAAAIDAGRVTEKRLTPTLARIDAGLARSAACRIDENILAGEE
jgi:beta-N-acetylhexosaminidase